MIPKNFVPEKKGKLKIKYLEKQLPKENKLEELVIDEKIFSCMSKKIYTSLHISDLKYFGITPELIKNVINVRYNHYGFNPIILLIEYKSKNDLKKELPKIFERGIEDYSEIEKFSQTFMFKNDIAIFIEHSLTEKAVPYYKKLGFKRLKCIFKGE